MADLSKMADGADDVLGPGLHGRIVTKPVELERIRWCTARE